MTRTDTAMQQDLARSNGQRGPMPATPLPTRQRRPAFVAAAVAVIVGCAALGGWLYLRAGAKTPVVVVTRDVPAGHTLTRADLSTVAISGDVPAVAGSGLDRIVGRTATVHLLPGTVLQLAMVTTTPPLSAAQAAIGLALRSGRLPADGLVPGDVVAVVALGEAPTGSGKPPAAASVLVERAQVFAVRDDPAQTGGVLVTVVIPKPKMVDIAAAGGTGRVTLVRVS